MSLPTGIQTEDDVLTFITHLISGEGLNFHPDTAFSDYVSTSDGSPAYSNEKRAIREELLTECFVVAGEGVYVIGLEILKSVYMLSP